MIQDLMTVRIQKIARLRELGVNPYPYRFTRTHTTAEVMDQFQTLENNTAVSLAGRLMAIRNMGKASFAQILDPAGRLQLYLRKDELGELGYEIFSLLDIGDLVGVHGEPFRTRTGEITLRVTALEVLCKAIRPLPVVKEKDGKQFHAWKDVEARYRRRHVDLILHPEIRRTFEIRASVLRTLRRFLDTRGFLEVETPILQSIYGGAMARPFVTHHNSLDMRLFLRIAEELPLKKLLVGGMERVYELGRVFRNEGMDRTHNPEFTMLEFYWAWADYHEAMDVVEEMIRVVVAEASGELRCRFNEHDVDLAPPFLRRSMSELVKDHTGLDALTATEEDLRAAIRHSGEKVPTFATRGHLIEQLFDSTVQPLLIQPTFVTDHPLAISPLAKAHRLAPGDLVERFELFIGGKEFGNAFSELNDPVDQRRRFEEQTRQREAGNEEAQVLDEEFLDAVETGMPPAAGVGLGIDRLVILAASAHGIRDVLLFPHLRPEEGRASDEDLET